MAESRESSGSGTTDRSPVEAATALAGMAAVWAALDLSSRYSYLLFHSLVEIVTAVVAFTLLSLTWNTRRFLDHDGFKLLGIGYGLIAIIDLVHTLAYKGMNIFPGYDANLPTQLWIAARYLQAATLVAAPLLTTRRVGTGALVATGVAAVGALIVLPFLGLFPDCFVEGRGLTPFKIASEYVITAALLVAMLLFHRVRQRFSRGVYALVQVSIVCTAISELSFTAYLSVYGFANLLGHLLKLAAFYLIYRALLVTGLRRPFELIFRDLQATQDALRGAQATLEDKVRERTEELRASEEKYRVLSEDLDRRVTRRTAELEAANTELESFAYSVSHDLRAPLRAIDGYSRILVEDYGAGLDPDARHYLDLVRRSAAGMDRLIRDILQFSRTSRQAITLEPVDMADLVPAVFRELREAVPDRHIELRLGDLPPVVGDRAMIRQVLANLLANAIKYTGPRAEAVIEVDGTCADGEVTYRFRDNGVGFDMQFADKLFGVFQRLHRADEFEGTGIGLAIVKRIVTRHGGRVRAEGKVGEGATFRFTLPAAGSDGPADGASPPA